MTAVALALPFEPAPAPPAPRFWRLVRTTTKQAWYVIREKLSGRERAVYFGLMAYYNRHQEWPTSMELLEFLLELKRRHPRHPRYQLIHDVNSVRPRLTGLNAYQPALVVTGPKRLCRSYDARRAHGRSKTIHVFTWRIPQLGDSVR